MSNYFIFIDAVNDAACYPVERLVSMTCTSYSTLELSFERGLKGLGGEHDVVTLTFTQPAATATITITDYTELNAGDKVNLVATDGTNYDFVQGDQSSVNGTFEATTSNNQTATNLMNVINTSSGPSGTRFTAIVTGPVVTATQATGGLDGNTTVTLTDTFGAGMKKTNFTDGLNIEDSVMKSIATAATDNSTHVVIADDVTGNYIDGKGDDSNITACNITYVTGGIEQVHHFGLSGMDDNTATYFSWCSTNSNQTDIFNHRGLQPRAGKIISASLMTDKAISEAGTGCAITFTGSSTTGATTHTDGEVGSKVWTAAATGSLSSLEGYTWAANDIIIATITPQASGMSNARGVATLVIQWSN